MLRHAGGVFRMWLSDTTTVWWWWRVYIFALFFSFFLLRRYEHFVFFQNENVLPLFSFLDSHSDSAVLSLTLRGRWSIVSIWCSAARWKYAKRSSRIISLLGIISFAFCPYTRTGTSRRREYTKYSQTRNERRHIDAVMVFFFSSPSSQ